MTRFFIAAALASVPTIAAAEVQSATPYGFAVESSAVVPVAPDRAYAALGEIGRWWDGAHSYSGDAANLRLELKGGGCWCETVPQDGSTMEHMRVVQARPGQLLRVAGALGPLQAEGVAGSLSWTLEPVPQGTRITQSYVVGGFVRGGAEAFAKPVDQVLAQQLTRLARYLGDGGAR